MYQHIELHNDTNLALIQEQNLIDSSRNQIHNSLVQPSNICYRLNLHIFAKKYSFFVSLVAIQFQLNIFEILFGLPRKNIPFPTVTRVTSLAEIFIYKYMKHFYSETYSVLRHAPLVQFKHIFPNCE